MEDKRGTATSKRSYRKSLGLFELVGFGLGGTIRSGIFIVPGIAAGIAGPSSILAWIFACMQLQRLPNILQLALSIPYFFKFLTKGFRS